MGKTPDWIISQRRAENKCITCGKACGHQVQCDSCWDKKHGEKA